MLLSTLWHCRPCIVYARKNLLRKSQRFSGKPTATVECCPFKRRPRENRQKVSVRRITVAKLYVAVRHLILDVNVTECLLWSRYPADDAESFRSHCEWHQFNDWGMLVQAVIILSFKPRAASGVVRIDPLHFLVGCRKRRLNQALSFLSLSLGFFSVYVLCC